MCLNKVQMGKKRTRQWLTSPNFPTYRQAYLFYLQICMSDNRIIHRLTVKFTQACRGLVKNLSFEEAVTKINEEWVN